MRYKIWSEYKGEGTLKGLIPPRLISATHYVLTFDDEWRVEAAACSDLPLPSPLQVTLALPPTYTMTLYLLAWKIDFFSSLRVCCKWHSGTVSANVIHWDTLHFGCSLNRKHRCDCTRSVCFSSPSSRTSVIKLWSRANGNNAPMQQWTTVKGCQAPTPSAVVVMKRIDLVSRVASFQIRQEMQ